MTFSQNLCFGLALLISVNANVVPPEDSPDDFKNGFSTGKEERSLQEEIFQELNRLSTRKQREIFDDLEKQLDVSQKTFVLAEPDHLSPLNLDDLKTIQKSIKTHNSSSLPPVRSKRTLNFLLSLVARAMGYTLTPTNPDAEWLPRQAPRPSSPPPCAPPPSSPPCTPSPPTSPAPPCPAPPTPPPCRPPQQTATVPPYQTDPNTISYPFRPARTIPLFNFSPLPQGVMVPYPPLFQPQRANPTQPPCGATPAPSTPPPCGTTPAPSPPPCATTPAPKTPPCATTPAPRPPPCTTPAPSPPPCGTTPAPRPPPCATTPAPRPPPCNTTPAPRPPPCITPAPSPPPCGTTPAPPPPCATPPPPPPPPPKPSNTPKKSLLLDYDHPVRIQIFSDDKKFLPASGNIYSGHEDGYEENLHSHFFPTHEDFKKNDEDVEDEEIQEEHVEEEEEEEVEEPPKKQGNKNLKTYEEEDERILASDEGEEDESETSLSIVKKPTAPNKQTRRMLPSDKEEKAPKMKKPKRKKWVRIVKKQRRKTSKPQENWDAEASTAFQSQRLLDRRVRERPFDFGQTEENAHRVHLKKVVIHDKDIASRQPALDAYNFNVDPYAAETEADRRKRLEQAVEKYVEDYVEKQLGAELVKNSGVPKTTVFEFAPKNGPKIQTITTTVAKTTHSGKARPRPEPRDPSPPFRHAGNTRFPTRPNCEESLRRRGACQL